MVFANLGNLANLSFCLFNPFIYHILFFVFSDDDNDAEFSRLGPRWWCLQNLATSLFAFLTLPYDPRPNHDDVKVFDCDRNHRHNYRYDTDGDDDEDDNWLISKNSQKFHNFLYKSFPIVLEEQVLGKYNFTQVRCQFFSRT